MTRRTMMWAVLMAVGCGLPADPPPTVQPEAQTTAEGSLTQEPSRGGLQAFLYAPASLAAGNIPLVVALHGCTQSAGDYQAAGWNALADERGFLVLYPQTTDNNNCFAWFDPAQASRGNGQAQAIAQMVESVRSRYPLGSVFVTGLSAGGAMTAVMAASYPDVFSAAAVMAGLPYGCATSQLDAYRCMYTPQSKSASQWGDLVRLAAPTPAAWPRMAVFHGDADYTVVPANADELVQQWTNLHGLSTASSQDEVGRSHHTVYADSAGVPQIESFIVTGMGHGTALDPAHGCGKAAAFMLDVGLCSTREAARFFGLTGGAGVGAGDGGTQGGGEDGGSVDGGALSCTEVLSDNYDHWLAGRAVMCPNAAGQVCARDSGEPLGLFNVFVTSWVKHTEQGYSAGRCAP